MSQKLANRLELQQNWNCVPRRLLLNIHHTLIAPYLFYGICTWSNSVQSSSKEIIGIGKSVLFVWSFFCGNAREHAISFFITANCLPLSLSFFQCVSYLMYDIQGQSAPIHVLNQFTETTTVHNYNTRASSKDLFDVLKGFKNWANEKHSCKNLSSWFATLSFIVLDRFVHLNFIKLWRKYFSIL